MGPGVTPSTDAAMTIGAPTRTSAVPAITSYQRYQPIADNRELQVSQFAVSSRAERDFGYKPMKGFTARTVPYSRSC
jgi:hypothetical protein